MTKRARSPIHSQTPPPPWSPPRSSTHTSSDRPITFSAGANGSWRKHQERERMDQDRAPPPPAAEARGKNLPAALGLSWLEEVDKELLGVLAGFLEAMEKLERDSLIAQLTDYTTDERATFIALLPQLRQSQPTPSSTETETTANGPVVHPSRRFETLKPAAPPPPPAKLGTGMRSDWD